MAGPRVARPGYALVALLAITLATCPRARAQSERVVDVPTRPGVTQRFLLVPGREPVTAAAILFAGGHGGLAIDASGRVGWGGGNFLVRTRQLFANRGITVAVVDALSDRQEEPWLNQFRQTREHAEDMTAVIAWLRREVRRPVWLVGTSRGTQSAGFLAHTLAPPEGADGVVLTSTILDERRGRPVSAMPVERIAIPALVVHHRHDGCRVTPYAMAQPLVDRLTSSPRKALVTVEGGVDRGDPCEARGHHGYAGVEERVVDEIARFVSAR